MSSTESATRLPKTLGGQPWKGPARFQLFVEFAPSTAPGEPDKLDKYVGRVGVTNDLSKIPGMIADDLIAMRDTFGGLFEPTSTKGRVYRVFEMHPCELDCAAILKQYAAPVTAQPRRKGRFVKR